MQSWEEMYTLSSHEPAPTLDYSFRLLLEILHILQGLDQATPSSRKFLILPSIPTLNHLELPWPTWDGLDQFVAHFHST